MAVAFVDFTQPDYPISAFFQIITTFLHITYFPLATLSHFANKKHQTIPNMKR